MTLRNLDGMRVVKRGSCAEKHAALDLAQAEMNYKQGIGSTPQRVSSDRFSSATRQNIDLKLQFEILSRRILCMDLVESVFGHLISIDIAVEILEQLVHYGVLSVYERVGSDTIDEGDYSEKLSAACQEARAAASHAARGGERPPRDQFTWEWTDLATGKESETVDFMNVVSTISYLIFRRLKAHTVLPNHLPRLRFSVNPFPNSPLPLLEASEQADRRPDFLSLPSSAWTQTTDPSRLSDFVPDRHPVSAYITKLSTVVPSSSPRPVDKNAETSDMKEFDLSVESVSPADFVRVCVPRSDFQSLIDGLDPQYLEWYKNYTSKRLLDLAWANFDCNLTANEVKQTAFPAAIRQTHSYMRMQRRAQPWLQFVIGFAATQKKLALLRADASGVEECVLHHHTSRGVVDIVRIALGLVLSEDTDLGLDRRFTLVDDVVPYSSSIQTGSPKKRPTTEASVPSQTKSSTPLKMINISQYRKRRISSIRDANAEYNVDFLIFDSDSLSGRGTRVWRVHTSSNPTLLLAYKLSNLHPDRVRNSQKLYQAVKSGVVQHFLCPVTDPIEDASILLTVRGIDPDKVTLPQGLVLESRVPVATITPYKRTLGQWTSLEAVVCLFIDILKGIESAGAAKLLHRDLSPDNVVFGLPADDEDIDLRDDYVVGGPSRCSSEPGQSVGLINDYDMAGVLQKPVQVPKSKPMARLQKYRGAVGHSQHQNDHRDSDPASAVRTGTTPYMAIRALEGKMHVKAFDVESVFYMIYLFFFTFDGPSSSTYPEKPSVEYCEWPEQIEDWAIGDDFLEIAKKKRSFFEDEQTILEMLYQTKATYWLQTPRRIALAEGLISLSWKVFWIWIPEAEMYCPRAGVTPGQLIAAITFWLKWKKSGAEYCPVDDFEIP